MLLGDRILKAYDITKQPELTNIRNGVNMSSRRLSLLKCGRSFSKAIYLDPIDLLPSSKSRLVSVSPRDSKENLVHLPLDIIKTRWEKEQAYTQSLVGRLKFTGEKSGKLSSKGSESKISVFRPGSPVNLDKSKRLNKFKLLTENEIIQQSEDKFSGVSDPEMYKFLVSCHATSLRIQKVKKLEKGLNIVDSVREQLVLNHSPKAQKPVVFDKKLTITKRIKPAIRITNPRELKRLSECLFSSSFNKLTLSPRFMQNYKSSIIKTEPSILVHSTSNLASLTKDHQQTTSSYNDLPDPIPSMRKKKPKEKVAGAPKIRIFSLNNLFNPGSKQAQNFEKLAISKSKNNDYHIRDRERENQRKAMKIMVNSKKSEDNRIAGLLGE